MKEVLDRLRELAELDETYYLLAGRLSDLDQEEKSLRARIAEEEEQFARRREEHRKLRQAASDRSSEADHTDAKIREYQRKLERDIIPYKEMEYLREQVTLLRAQLDHLSEEAIALMDEVDKDTEKLSQDEARHKERKVLLETEVQTLERKREEILREREEIEAKRKAVLAGLPPNVRAQYERLKAILPDPVVIADDQTCGGCHLRLSEVTLDKLREGREVVTCENCSRFLLWRWR